MDIYLLDISRCNIISKVNIPLLKENNKESQSLSKATRSIIAPFEHHCTPQAPIVVPSPSPFPTVAKNGSRG